MKSLLRSSLLAIGLLLLVGCSTTPVIKAHNEPDMDETEVCYLRVSNSIYIEMIDGVQLPQNSVKWSYFNPTDGSGRVPRVIELLPGSHALAINFRSTSHHSRRPKTLRFTGQTGHLYYIDSNADYKASKWHPKIVDCTNTETGEKYILVPLRKYKEQLKQNRISK